MLDAAATAKSAKCSLFFTPKTNGLAQSWDCGGAVFCNPPYGREIGKWVKKAHEEAAIIKYPIVMLLPARTDMEWEELAEKLADGFLIDASEELKKGEADAVKVLAPHWKNIFPNYNYSYSSEEIKRSFVLAESNDSCTVTIEGEELELFGKDYSDDFYKFNYYADKHLICLYGEHPRNWLSESETEENKITV